MNNLDPLIMQKLSLILAVLCLAVGCREAVDSHGHSHDGEDAHSHDAVQSPPHGGTPVLVADDEFHLELVLDPTAARMQAYVLDGHLESYVSVAETNFTLVATLGGSEQRLEFRRVPDTAVGAIGDKSARFEAGADWLRSVKEFEGAIPSITLNGKTFSNISFKFPKGTMHVH
jgi:hypothetical protein